MFIINSAQFLALRGPRACVGDHVGRVDQCAELVKVPCVPDQPRERLVGIILAQQQLLPEIFDLQLERLDGIGVGVMLVFGRG